MNFLLSDCAERGDLQNLFEVNNATIKALEKRSFPSDSSFSGGTEDNGRCSSIIIFDNGQRFSQQEGFRIENQICSKLAVEMPE